MPPSLATLRVYVADCPGETVAEGEEPDADVTVKSWPVPLSATACGLPGALSEMLMLPLRVPPAVGLKVTLIVQLAPSLTLLPQLFVCEKSPLTVIPEIDSPAFPELVRVMACATAGPFHLSREVD